MNQLLEFQGIMNETLVLLDTIIEIENRKLDAIAVNDTARLESLMNEEQAFLLQFRGYDKKREDWQKRMGCETATFKEILESLSPEERIQIEPLYQQMNEKVKEVKSVTTCAKKYIELHLHSLNALISSMQKGQPGTPYNNLGETQPGTHQRKLQNTRI